jgi:hypothetical protein
VSDEVRELVKYLKNLPPPPKLSPVLNKVVDKTLHPLGERNRWFYVLDSVTHTFVEQVDTLIESLYKTVKYNLEKIVGGEGETTSSGRTE